MYLEEKINTLLKLTTYFYKRHEKNIAETDIQLAVYQDILEKVRSDSMNRDCINCSKRKTMLCPNSKECYATEDKPYFESNNDLNKENQQLKEQLQQYENHEDLTLMFMYCDVKSKDKIKELQNQLQQRDEVIKEAIEYIATNYVTDSPIKFKNDLFTILQKYKGGK